MKIYKTNIEIERYEGIWAFSYISDYILSIVPQDKKNEPPQGGGSV